MLRYAADRRTLGYLAATALLALDGKPLRTLPLSGAGITLI